MLNGFQNRMQTVESRIYQRTCELLGQICQLRYMYYKNVVTLCIDEDVKMSISFRGFFLFIVFYYICNISARLNASLINLATTVFMLSIRDCA